MNEPVVLYLALASDGTRYTNRSNGLVAVIVFSSLDDYGCNRFDIYP